MPTTIVHADTLAGKLPVAPRAQTLGVVDIFVSGQSTVDTLPQHGQNRVLRVLSLARIGTVPYGFDLADDGATLIENPAEQAIIADIKTMRSAGKKLKQIANVLTERGIPTKTGKSDRWTHQAVARILKRVNC